MATTRVLKIAVKFDGVKYSDGTTRTFRYSNTGFVANINGDNALLYYAPMIGKKSIVSELEAFKQSSGMAISLNNNGELDELNDYSFDGQPIQIYISMEDSPNPIAFFSLYKGKIKTLNIKRLSVEVKAESPFKVFDTPVNPKTFLGSGTPYEGSDELINKTKPRVIGKVFNITPEIIGVSATRGIYGCNWDVDGNRAPLLAITAVRDGGVALELDTTKGASGDFATTALMDAGGSEPANFKYTTCLAEGTIKLGSLVQVGPITMDVEEQTNTYGEWMQQVSTELSLDGFAVQASTPTFKIGGYFTSPINYVNVDKYLVNDIDVTNWFGSDGRINSGRVRDDGSDPLVNFVKVGQEPVGDDDIFCFEIIRDRYENPPKQTQMAYKKNFTQHTDEGLAGSLTEDQKTELKEEYRYLLDSNVCTTDPYALDKSVETVTAIYDSSEAQTELNEWVASRSKVRDYLSIECPILASNNNVILGIVEDGDLTSVNIASTTVKISSTAYRISYSNAAYSGQRMLRIGDIVTLKDDRIDYTNDRFVVYGVTINTKKMLATYKVFGLRSSSTCT